MSVTTVTAPSSLSVETCPLNVPAEPVNAAVPAAGGSRTLEVITGAACNWTAGSGSAFITIAPTTGRGSGTVTLSVQANSGAQRSGTVTINQFSLTISQSAAACTFGLSPTSQSFDANGGTGTIAVTVTQGLDCQWTATSNSPFIDVSSGAAGTGNGSVAFRVAANSGAARGGTLTIAGLTFTVNQGAVPPPPPPNVTLSVGGYVQPWCAASFGIQSSPGPNFPSPSAPGPFTYAARSLSPGTSVLLSGSGAGVITDWSGCDSESAGSCSLTMYGDRSPRARMAQSCASPSFMDVESANLSGTWEITFTAVNLLRVAGTVFGGVTITASCPGFSTSSQLPSQASGSISGTINVPSASCNGGTLSLSDFNGTASTTW